MRYFVIILTLFILFLSCKTTVNGQDKLPSFTVWYIHGDNSVRTNEIKVYIKDEKYYADNIMPVFYYGNQTDSVWTTELDQAKKIACHRFISKAKKLPRECPPRCVCVEDYYIVFSDDTIRISGGCNWGNLDFLGFRGKLFKEHFVDLEVKRENLINDLNKKLMGKWYFAPLNSPLIRGDTLELTKINDNKPNNFWEFSKHNAFSCSKDDFLSLQYSKEYLWGVSEGDITLNIQLGLHKDESGIPNLSDGAHFFLDKIDDNKLTLKFLSK
jgi:hypothetical protein